MNLPNLFLLSAPRSGSTQLVHWLNSHPQISASAIKEPNYFARSEFAQAVHQLSDIDPVLAARQAPLRYQFSITQTLEAYCALFAPLQTRFRLDGSTSTLTAPDAPYEILRHFPQSRFIVITRDPLERAISHYKLARRMGRACHSLGEALRLEQQKAIPYHERYLLRFNPLEPAILRYENIFGTEAILKLRFEEMVLNPRQTLGQCAAFLDIDDEFDLSVRAQNKGVLPRFSGLNRWAEAYGIKSHFRRYSPKAIKPLMRRLWFKSQWDEDISPQDLAALQTALGGA